MRLAVPFTILALAAALLAGCGGSSSEQGSTEGGSTQSEKPTPPRGRSPGAPVGASVRPCDTHAVDAESLRATGASCQQARRVMFGWQRSFAACSGPAGASRVACDSGSYRCVATQTERGSAVSCARPGQSVAFIAKR